MTIPYLYEILLPPGDGLVETYALLDPDGSRARYVGISNYAAGRYVNHMSSANTHRKKHGCIQPGKRGYNVQAWLSSLIADGTKPKVVVLELVPEHQGEDAERRWISLLRGEGHPLLNFRGGWESGWFKSAR